MAHLKIDTYAPDIGGPGGRAYQRVLGPLDRACLVKSEVPE